MSKLSIELRPSRYLAAFLLLTHGGILLILLSFSLAWWGHWAISLIVITSFFLFYRHYVARQAKYSVLGLRFDGKDWYLNTRSKGELKAYLKGESFSAEKLLVLNFRLSKKRKNIPVIIFSDALDKKTFKALKVIVRRN